MVTSLRTGLNPVHQTSAEDVDDDIDYEQVMKTAPAGGGGFVYISWQLEFFFPFWMFLIFWF